MVTEVSTVETISSIWRTINPSFIQQLVLVLFIIFVKVGLGVATQSSPRTFDEIRLGTQKFYLKHTDDIISMAVHTGDKHGNIVASGQIGENPTIHVWNPQTRNTISVLSGRHKRGVCSLSFSTSGKFLLSVGVDAPFTIAVWRWEEGLTAILRRVNSNDHVALCSKVSVWRVQSAQKNESFVLSFVQTPIPTSCRSA